MQGCRDWLETRAVQINVTSTPATNKTTYRAFQNGPALESEMLEGLYDRMHAGQAIANAGRLGTE